MQETSPGISAFNTLYQHLERAQENVDRLGEAAWKSRDHEQAKVAAENALQLEEIVKQFQSLRQGWEVVDSLLSQDSRLAVSVMPPVSKEDRLHHGIARIGERTQEIDFYLPILELIEEAGGRARADHLLDQLEKKMRSTLQQGDYETLSSKPGVPRWRNTAQWARNQMIEKGYLLSNSQFGIWEITGNGRGYLKDNLARMGK